MTDGTNQGSKLSKIDIIWSVLGHENAECQIEKVRQKYSKTVTYVKPFCISSHLKRHQKLTVKSLNVGLDK